MNKIIKLNGDYKLFTAQGEEQLTLSKFSKIQRRLPKHLDILTEVWGIDKLSNDDILNEFNKLMMDSQYDSLAIQKCCKLKKTEPGFHHFDSKATTEVISNLLAIYFSTTYSLDEVALNLDYEKNYFNTILYILGLLSNTIRDRKWA